MLCEGKRKGGGRWLDKRYVEVGQMFWRELISLIAVPSNAASRCRSTDFVAGSHFASLSTDVNDNTNGYLGSH